MSLRFLDRLLPNVNVVPSRFWFPLGLPCLQVDPMAARKKGDLVLYCAGLFPTEARKLPSGPLVNPKMDLYCRGFSLSETSERRSSSWLVLHRSQVHTIPGVAIPQKLDPAVALGLPIYWERTLQYRR